MESEKGHLLVVDPNEMSRTSLSIALEQLGYKVSVAADASEALQTRNLQPFDLVLLDIQTLPLQGLQVLEQLKAQWGGAESHREAAPHTPERLLPRPVIVLASKESLESVEKCLEMGADDYILVPFSPVLLKARLEGCLQKERLSQQTRSQLVKLARMEKLASDFTNTILPLGKALSAETDFGQLIERILLETKAICNADMGILYLHAENKHLKLVILRNDSQNVAWGGTAGTEITLPLLPLYDKQGKPNDKLVATLVAVTGESINIPDVYESEEFDFSENKAYDAKQGYRSVSCLTVPLKNKDNEMLGIVQLVNAQNPTTGEVIPFNSYLQQVVESLASQASIALNNLLLLQRQTKLLKGDRDLEIGRMIQADFLPETLPVAEGWEIAARFSPARQVAGDFYDAFPMIHGRIGLVIADVCDKGVGPAMFMALCRSLIRVLAQQNFSLGLLDVLSDDPPKGSSKDRTQQRSLPKIGTQALKNAMKLTNDYIGNNHSRTNMFATMFFGVLDTKSGSLIYINGGHELPIVCGPNGIKERLKTTGPAVGMMPNIDFKIQQTKLDPGDILFSYTDGVPEAHNPQGQLFTDEKLFELLQEPASSAEALLERVETTVRSHIADADQFDDITMLAVRRAPVSEGASTDIS